MANSTDNEGVSKRVERRTSAERYHKEEAVRKGMWMGEIKWEGCCEAGGSPSADTAGPEIENGRAHSKRREER